jgi:hypothetical protein
MTVTIELTDAQAAAITQRAEREGTTLEGWIQSLIASCVPPNTAAHLPYEEWLPKFEEWIASLPKTPVLSDEAMSRESIYPDRS